MLNSPYSWLMFMLSVSQLLSSIKHFHPRSVPLMARLSYQRELTSWSLLPLMLSGLQAGTIAIFLKKTFAGVEGISSAQLNIAVGLLAASKAIGFLSSFIWASISRGRPKIRFMVSLQLLTSAVVASIAWVPLSASGMWAVTILCVVAWSIWSGVMILRTGVWRANYADAYRPSIAGRISSIDGVVMAVAALAIGACLDYNPMTFRFLFVAMGCIGVVGALLYRRMPFRRERRHLATELAADSQRRTSLSPLVIARVLRHDPWYRGYMACMFSLGFGNLMLHPILTIALADEFHVSYGQGIAISTVIPLLFMVLAIPFWSRRLERMHVIQFRSVHAWSFATVSLLVLAGVVFHQVALLFLAAVCLGIGYGGGILAWNLGHQHFAPPDRDAEYMSVHVTLTGIRGVIGPILGVQLYLALSAITNQTAALAYCFAICLLTNLVGALGFVWLSHRRNASDAEQARKTQNVPIHASE